VVEVAADDVEVTDQKDVEVEEEEEEEEEGGGDVGGGVGGDRCGKHSAISVNDLDAIVRLRIVRCRHDYSDGLLERSGSGSGQMYGG
jgi:hypothetical protein